MCGHSAGQAPHQGDRGPTLVTRIVASAPVRRCASIICFMGYPHTTSLRSSTGVGAGEAVLF